METAPFGKRQKGEIGKNYFYVIIEVKTEQDPTLSDEFFKRTNHCSHKYVLKKDSMIRK